ncbi:MAG: protein kinase [Gemmatimonadota bacterium]|nr:MAG: protein kinase [Gemmatimonadota bacterium]
MNTTNCTNCGGQIYPSDRFCAHCGALQEPGVAVPEGEKAGSLWDPVLVKLRAATAGKYEIGRVLGAGGMAAVYLGREIRLDRTVAIKVMSPGLMLQSGMIERFRQEAVTVAALNHPNIVTIYTVEETDDLHFFVMKHIAGPSLEIVIRRDGPLPKSVVRAWLAQVGDALAYAHKRGVIHRDIKPANILLDDEGNAIVTDFGIAKVPRRSNLTQTGMTLGTPAYMSPEQCASKEVTAASDQYSLGIVTYEMLTGEPPFTGPSLEVMKAHVEQPPRPITLFRPHAPPELVAAVERMLEKDPRDRWPSLKDVIRSIGPATMAHDDPVRAQLAALATSGAQRAPAVDRSAPAATPPEARPITPAEARPVTPPEAAGIPEYLVPEAPAPVDSLLLAPVPPSIWEGHTLQLQATPLDAAGQPLAGREVTWQSSDPEVASVSESGLLEAREPGSAAITATCEDRVETVAIEVAPIRAEAVRVRPSRRVMAVGHSVQMRAIVRGSDGSRLHDRPVGWASGDSEIADVSPEGLVTAVAEGSVQVTAVCEEESAAAAVKVTAPGVPYLVGRFWWTAPAAAVALLALWLAVRPSGLIPEPAPFPPPAPVREDTTRPPPGPENEEALAEAARRQAVEARDAAVAAGAAGTDPTGFENLSRQLQEAEAELAAGNPFRALTLLEPLPQAFNDLAEVARNERENLRSAATAERTSASQQRSAANSAGAEQLRPTELARLNSLMRGAESAYSAGRYQDAQTRFSELVTAYRQLAQTCAQLARSEAEAARLGAAQQRQSALDAGAAERRPNQLAAIDADRDRAQSLIGYRRYLDAWRFYEAVEAAYRQLAADVAAEPDPEPQPLPEEVLADMIERFRQLFEEANLAAMAEELYRGRVPSDDERLLQTFFGRAEQMQAELARPNIRVEDSSATADIRMSLDFRLRRTGEQYTDVRYEFRLTFARGSAGWRLQKLESR